MDTSRWLPASRCQWCDAPVGERPACALTPPAGPDAGMLVGRYMLTACCTEHLGALLDRTVARRGQA